MSPMGVRLVPLGTALLSSLALPVLANFEKAVPAIGEIKKLACAQQPTTDKMSGGGYELMYGMFLMPLRNLDKTPKVLEIGLGCDQVYGAGASAKLWRLALPNAELWEAETDAVCVRKHRERLLAQGIHALVGDQNNRSTVEHWIRKSGGHFSVVIDDGAHKNGPILTSFQMLWPHVVPGGLYFIEDLHVGRKDRWDDTKGEAVMADVLQAWMEQKMIFSSWRDGSASNYANRQAQQRVAKWPVPKNVAFIFCQNAACVIGKTTNNIRARSTFGAGKGCPAPGK